MFLLCLIVVAEILQFLVGHEAKNHVTIIGQLVAMTMVRKDDFTRPEYQHLLVAARQQNVRLNLVVTVIQEDFL